MATKKRLIDANALVIEELLVMDRDYINEFASGCRKVMNVIRRLPTVDAEEVVHGRWVEWYPPMHMIMTGEELLYRCSACDAKYPDVEGYRYCPHCGAKMDGGVSNGL